MLKYKSNFFNFSFWYSVESGGYTTILTYYPTWCNNDVYTPCISLNYKEAVGKYPSNEFLITNLTKACYVIGTIYSVLSFE